MMQSDGVELWLVPAYLFESDNGGQVVTAAADVSGTLEAVLEEPGLDPETRRMTERRLAVSLFFAGRTKDARVLAERHRPTIPLRGYGDALALGIRRLIEMETGAGPQLNVTTPPLIVPAPAVMFVADNVMLPGV